jgi:hypothetical protein
VPLGSYETVGFRFKFSDTPAVDFDASAIREFESWFLAGIESLRGRCGVDPVIPEVRG